MPNSTYPRLWFLKSSSRGGRLPDIPPDRTRQVDLLSIYMDGIDDSEPKRCFLDSISHGSADDSLGVLTVPPSRPSTLTSHRHHDAIDDALPHTPGNIKHTQYGSEAALDVEMALRIPHKNEQCRQETVQELTQGRLQCLSRKDVFAILIMGGGAWAMSGLPTHFPGWTLNNRLFIHVNRQHSEGPFNPCIDWGSKLDKPALPTLFIAMVAYATSAGSQYYRLKDHKHIDISLVSSLTGGLIGGLLLGLDLVYIIFAVLPWCIMTAIALCTCI
jgi:hypothetical protein